MVQKLIEYEVDIHAGDEDGWTPVHEASRSPYVKSGSVLRLLLERGADVNARARNGWTPLHEASRYDAELEGVRLLLECGADVEGKDIDGMVPEALAGS